MGKNYRNCTTIITQIPQPSRLPEDLSKRKESITNCNSSVNTVSRTSVRSGESISSSLSSERLPVNSSLLRKKTPEDFSKVLPSSIECTDMVSSPTKSSNSITFWVSPSTNSSIKDSRLESIRKASKPNLSIKPES